MKRRTERATGMVVEGWTGYAQSLACWKETCGLRGNGEKCWKSVFGHWRSIIKCLTSFMFLHFQAVISLFTAYVGKGQAVQEGGFPRIPRSQ